MTITIFIGFKRIIDVFFKRRLWRKVNLHNSTIMEYDFPIDLVTIGINTYGKLRVKSFCSEAGEKLIIGNYVSIADSVTFLLGGNHHMNGLTTFPLKTRLTDIQYPDDATSKGPIIIEDDVWIGYGSTILSGVKIGKGAILAAGSVITSDIPPYSIAGGVPAKVIKYRFSPEITNKLIGFNLSDYSTDNLLNNIDLFYSKEDFSLAKFDYIVSTLNGFQNK